MEDIKVGDRVVLTETGLKTRIEVMKEWVGVVRKILKEHYLVKWPNRKDVSHTFTSYSDRNWTERKENLKKALS